MVLNPYFQQGAVSEQNLVQSLINEQLKMYGVDVYYIPRRYIKKNTVIKEVVESEFDNAYPIEAYVDNYEGYGGQGTILSKFGIEERDDLTLVISRERYETYITPLIKNIPNIELSSRPKEGDLIYFPLGDRLFEIKYVEHEQPFYQLKKNYVYELRCELFRYEDEVIDTGIETIDDEIEQIGYIQTLTLIGAAVTATASATYIASGAINDIKISNMGNGYLTVPTVGFGSAPSGGVTAVGIASITSNYINCDGQTAGKVEAILLSNAGAGYTVAPWITIQGSTGAGAAATAYIGNGAIGIVSITSGGSGYTTNPVVTFNSGSGITSARGVGHINSAGVVTAAYVTYGGIGYTSTPVATIADPPGVGSGMGVGSFLYNEVITGQTSGTTARVKEWNSVLGTLEISIVDGTFQAGETIIGDESGAKYAIRVVNTDDLVSGFADNDHIETQADSIIDFTEKNPFGMP
tara:strand:- start:2509 stop:3903 length:1395 start_codon:yes stop_codon:yes gene_type:complete